MSGDRDQIKITRFMYSNQKKQDLAYCVPNSAPDEEKATEVRQKKPRPIRENFVVTSGGSSYTYTKSNETTPP